MCLRRVYIQFTWGGYDGLVNKNVEMMGMKTYSLDNTAKLYPAVAEKTNPCVFRLSAVLTEGIDPDALQQAADITIKRFPTMAVKLRKGLFWCSLAENNNPLTVRKESASPCSPILGVKEDNDHLLRILYFGRRMTVECFHALTDGMGAMEFLKSLLYQYLLFTGREVQDEGMLLLPQNPPEPQEEEDGCLRYYQKHARKSKLEERQAHAIPGTILKDRRTKVIHGVIPAAPLRDYARRHGTTITGYLAAVFAQAIDSTGSQKGRSRHPVRIVIPVNLRGIFPSKTLRNFVTQVSVSLPAASGQTIDNMVESVTAQMKAAVTEEHLSGKISAYVGYEKMLAGRMIPWLIKKAAISLVSKRVYGATTALLTNLGDVKLPKSMEQYVEMIEVVPSPKKSASINCGICSVGGKLNIAFAGNIAEPDVIERFFELIAQQTGLEAELYSNGWLKSGMQPAGERSLYPPSTAASEQTGKVRPIPAKASQFYPL
jgi:NRPS condensation-like uncharacterized protein